MELTDRHASSKRPLTAPEAARIADVHEETIRRWCKYGLLEHGRLGRMYVIDPIILYDFMRNFEPFRTHKPMSLFTSKSTMVTDRQILSDAAVARNQQRIQALETAVMTGELKPIYLDSAGNPR